MYCYIQELKLQSNNCRDIRIYHLSQIFIYQIDSLGDKIIEEEKLGVFYQVTQCPFGQKLYS